MNDPRMMVRCVPSAHGEAINSSLAPSLRKFWDLEFLEPDIIYPDFSSIKESKTEKWKKLFRFTLESFRLEDFSGQMDALQGSDKPDRMISPDKWLVIPKKMIKLKISAITHQ